MRMVRTALALLPLVACGDDSSDSIAFDGGCEFTYTTEPPEVGDPATGKPYNPDFAAMAGSAGVEGVSVDRASDLADAVRAGIAAGRPYLIDANIGADLNPTGAGAWELPGLGLSSPGFGKPYRPA